LVREFLEARLRAEEGDLALSELHRRVAYANEEANWRVAAHHYSAIKAWDDLQRVLVKSVGEIMASGEFEAAEKYAEQLGAELAEPIFDLFSSRVDLANGRSESAFTKATRAYERLRIANSAQRDLALSNLMSLYLGVGALDETRQLALRVISETSDKELRQIATATLLTVDASARKGSIRALDDVLADM